MQSKPSGLICRAENTSVMFTTIGSLFVIFYEKLKKKVFKKQENKI